MLEKILSHFYNVHLCQLFYISIKINVQYIRTSIKASNAHFLIKNYDIYKKRKKVCNICLNLVYKFITKLKILKIN